MTLSLVVRLARFYSYLKLIQSPKVTLGIVLVVYTSTAYILLLMPVEQYQSTEE